MVGQSDEKFTMSVTSAFSVSSRPMVKLQIALDLSLVIQSFLIVLMFTFQCTRAAFCQPF